MIKLVYEDHIKHIRIVDIKTIEWTTMTSVILYFESSPWLACYNHKQMLIIHNDVNSLLTDVTVAGVSYSSNFMKLKFASIKIGKLNNS